MKHILTMLLILTLTVGSIAGLVVKPVAARIYSVQPTNEDGGPPTDQFTTADPIFAVFRADLEGGRICVIDDEGNESHCKIIAAYIGTGWSFIARGLPVGTYRLRASDPGYEFFSIPFTVSPCVAPDCAERRRMSDAVVDEWKQTAAVMLERLHHIEFAINVLEYGHNFWEARGAIKDKLDRVKDDNFAPKSGFELELLATAGGVFSLGFTSIDFDIPGDAEEAYFALAKEVMGGAKRMYQDIHADPPDLSYTTVSTPAFSELPSTGNAEHDHLLSTLDRQRAFGRAQLRAYERYLGAVEAGNETYAHMQSQAIADYGKSFVVEMRASAAAMRSWAVQLDPNQPVITQERLDEATAVYERVRTSGFTQDELNQFTAAGLSQQEIEQVRAAFNEDISLLPAGVSMQTFLNQAANVLEARIPAINTLSQEAAWVADGRAPATIALSPASAALAVGATHTVSTAVTDERGAPVAGVLVALSVSGANSATLTATTNTSGVAMFSYVGNNQGADSLSAVAGTATSNNATVNWLVGPVNAIPSVQGRNADSPEGANSSYWFDFTDSDTQDTHTVTIDWGDGSLPDAYPNTNGNDGFILEGNGSGFVVAYHTYVENGIYNPTATVTDNHGGAGTGGSTVTVRNLLPVLGGVTLEEVNGEIIFKTDFTDPGIRDTHTAEINWGDGTTNPATVVEINGSGSASGRHVYGEPGHYVIVLTVSDDDGGTATRSTGLTVDDGGLGNTAPALQLSNYQTYESGGSFSAEFTDPDSMDVHTATIDWGDGSPVQPLFVRENHGSGVVFRDHVYVNNGNFNLRVTITDNHGGVASGFAPMTVHNGEPRVTFVIPSRRLLTPGEVVTAHANFNDYGINDTHTAVWNWGDGTTTAADFTEAAGFGQASGSHTYTTPGVYTISLNVTDNDGATGVGTTPEPIGVYAQLTEGSIKPVVTETGKVIASISGLGIIGQNGVLKVEKPAGATVRRAYMGAATTGFHRYLLRPDDVKLENVNVSWDIVTPSGIRGFNFWADVTQVVKPKIDSAPAGMIDLSISEATSQSTEGEVLIVIFDDPNQLKDNTVALLFGAQQTSGDTFAIRFAQPLDLSDPNFGLTMSLGISYGHQDQSGLQYSLIDVNGQRMTTSAGGEDDGEIANGALLTVGGIGDSPNNPSDPHALPTHPRSDDELYDLRPFVNAGDTELTVVTGNPSNDDNIFFAAFVLQNTAAVVGEGIILTPLSASKEVGTQHTLTATAQDAQGNLLQGRDVSFEILSGPHAGLNSTVATDAQGRAQFTYAGTQAGMDTILARFVNSEGSMQASNTVTVEWIARANAPTLLTVSPASGTYSGTTELSAHLTADGAPLNGREVSFKLNGATLGVATTDAGGVAIITTVSLAGINAGTHPNAIIAHFAGDAAYSASGGTADLIVSKAMPQVTWNNPADIPYGAALGNAQLNAVASVSGTFTYTPPAGTVLHAGNNQSLYVSFTPTDTTNYNTTSKDVSINVTKVPLTIVADDKLKVYGTVNPPLTVRYSGFVNGEDASILSGSLSLSTTATTGSSVGGYVITASGLTSSNYAITFVNGKLMITKAVLTITVDNKSKIYNTVNPLLTFKPSGFVNGDTAITAFSGVPTLATSAQTNSSVGTYPITAASGTLSSSNYSFAFVPGMLTVNRAPTTTVIDSKMYANKSAAVLSASLLNINLLPIANRTLTLSLGTGASAQTCSATTDVAGKASCLINMVAQMLGPRTISGSFAGDSNYLSSGSNTSTLIFDYPAGMSGGSFVIGDRNATVGSQVTFWGAQWANLNSLSGGAAPSSFKGFANQTSNNPAICGSGWTTGSGNSSGPPSTIPTYMAVIVSSSVTKSGSTITGNVPQMVIVKTNPGYDSNPGHAGSGTVVAVWCH